MHLNEFADPKIYALPADGMAAVLNQLENIWLDRGLEDDNAHIRRPRRQPNDRRRKLDEWRRDGAKRQSRRRHLSPLRSR